MLQRDENSQLIISLFTLSFAICRTLIILITSMTLKRQLLQKVFYSSKKHIFQPKTYSTATQLQRNSAPLHRPVMAKEVLDVLYPQKGDIILDMTFGAGGHTRAILESCTDCKVIALDRDPYAHSLSQRLAEETGGRVIPMLGRFSQLETLLVQQDITGINGALLDAGCSSMQFDTAERGFALSLDGPLDMRMDGERYPDMPTASDVVNRLSAGDLAEILDKYGEEKYAHKIARQIVRYRTEVGPITRTQEFANIVGSAFNEGSHWGYRTNALNRRAHSATKTFMAIRIFINNELNELYDGLKTVEKYMKQGGRLVAITFHSLEDVIVKRVISGTDINKPKGMTLNQQRRIDSNSDKNGKTERKWMDLNKKVVIPQFHEVHKNARSRSAKLRSATRLS